MANVTYDVLATIGDYRHYLRRSRFARRYGVTRSIMQSKGIRNWIDHIEDWHIKKVILKGRTLYEICSQRSREHDRAELVEIIESNIGEGRCAVSRISRGDYDHISIPIDSIETRALFTSYSEAYRVIEEQLSEVLQ